MGLFQLRLGVVDYMCLFSILLNLYGDTVFLERVQHGLLLVSFKQVDDCVLLWIEWDVLVAVELENWLLERREIVEVLICKRVRLIFKAPVLACSSLELEELRLCIDSKRGGERVCFIDLSCDATTI